eukprot:TRINITY_DN4183_c0_g1_i2.p1 TRINITY_DN4183_c0_g1~~TRINITY_DN4183_c0_g1_i2.p1  ORF type:complete len:769 (+),score=253.13 TRINITY_DN4183_c0_g1_i2:84-2390(+)
MGCGGSKSAAAAAPPAGGTCDSESQRLQFLSKVPLFKRLPKTEHPALAKAAVKVSFECGQSIFNQGDEGNEFFVIVQGSATVVIDGADVATLNGGDYFGESALLKECPRTATIKAKSVIEALKITRDAFTNLGLQDKLQFEKRQAVAGGIQKAEVKPPSQKTTQEVELMTQALKSNANLAAMVNLDDSTTKAMIDLMWKEQVAKGTELITQGDLNADYFYIVQEGVFQVSVLSDEGQSAEKAAGAFVGTIAKGGSFGELALMYFAPRAATLKCSEDATVWVIERGQFKNILAQSESQVTLNYVKYLDKVEILASLNDEEKQALAEALTEKSFTKDEEIFKQGEVGQEFYILIEGTVCVIKDNAEVAKLTATTKDTQFFGEQALLNNTPRGATIKVASESAKTLVVDKKSFDMLLGPLEELTKRGKTGTASIKKIGVPDTANSQRFGLIKRKDLKKVGLLGCGGFGEVFMVEHLPSSETYALKGLSKGYVVKTGMQTSVMNERNVQLMCDSPFVVKLFETYNGEQTLYLLLEIALGGELYATYNKKNLWGKEDCAKFYIAGTTLSFEHLHGLKVVFRDLKPENLLLTETGHIKLTDMGLAKVIVGKTYTTCGTPDYFAPELIASKGHTLAVDWWTLGVLCFELLAGHPPFESAAPMQIYKKVQKGIGKVKFPKSCTGKVESLIKGLCNLTPSERLPMKKGEINNIKTHVWFGSFDWEAFGTLQMKVPYKPIVKDKKDKANFSAKPEDRPPHMPYKDDGSGWDKNFATSE